MNRLSSRNNQLKFKTSGGIMILLDESREYTSIGWKQHRKMSTCNRLDSESLGSWPTTMPKNFPGTAASHKFHVWSDYGREGLRMGFEVNCWKFWVIPNKILRMTCWTVMSFPMVRPTFYNTLQGTRFMSGRSDFGREGLGMGFDVKCTWRIVLICTWSPQSASYSLVPL